MSSGADTTDAPLAAQVETIAPATEPGAQPDPRLAAQGETSGAQPDPRLAAQLETSAPASEPDTKPDTEPADADPGADEPPNWEDIELVTTDPREAPADPLFFAGEPPSDESFEHWLQSSLKRLIDPSLVVDGVVGLRTRQALKTFQRRSGRLTADGIAGPQTIAALASATGTTSPTRHAAASPALASEVPGAPAPAVVVAGDELRVHAVDGASGPQYIVSSRDDEVRFSYWAPGSDHGVRGRNDGYDLDRYVGGKVGVLSAGDYAALGRPPGAIKIFQANALKESRGLFGTVNTWDNQLVSWGAAQFAGRAGSLAALLSDLMEQADSRAAYQRFFAANGVTVEHGSFVARRGGQQTTQVGWHVVVHADDGPRAGDAGWDYLRSQPRMLGAFMLAGNDPTIQRGQVRFWLAHFFDPAIHRIVVRDHAGPHAISQYLTSEYALGLIARLFNWMPANVQTWFDEFTAELAKRHPGVDILDPHAWDEQPGLEGEFTALLLAKRRAVKKGSYDTFGPELDRTRGSYGQSKR